MRNSILRIGILAVLLLMGVSVLGQTVTSSNTYGENKWIGHVYSNNNLTNYYGYLERDETFIDWFGGSYVNFQVRNLWGGTSSVYTETFSVRYRMHSTKKGCYRVNFYGDDGIRLYVDGVKVFNRWVPQSPTSYNNVLINLTGDSNLKYEYYENGGQNVVAFREFVKLNEITSVREISLCPNARTFRNIQANALSITGSSISYTYSWQKKEEGGAWTNVSAGGFNTETSCRISDIYNDTPDDKIFYFRRRVVFNQSKRWGASAKSYVDNSDEVKVILKGLPSATITGGEMCEGDEIINFTAVKAGTYNIVLYDGVEAYSVTGLSQNDEINIRTRDGVLNYNIVITEIQQVGACVTSYSSGNEPATAKAEVNVLRRVKTKPIIRKN